MLGKLIILRTRETICLIVFIPIVSWSQVPFEKGYLVDTEGNRVECRIRNLDWKSNPSHFEYRLSEEKESRTRNISSVREFGVNGFSKYIVKTVRMDTSSDKITTLSSGRNPLWSEKQLALKVLVEGKSILYYYRNGNFIRFFYELNETPVIQLVFKRYLSDNIILINGDFRQQLWAEINCGGQHQSVIKMISYTIDDMVRHFEKYNACASAPGIVYDKRKSQFIPNFWITPGLDFASFEISQHIPSQDLYFIRQARFSRKVNFRLGFQSEFLIRYTDNKFSLLIEPTFQYFIDNKASNVVGERIAINYISMEVPLGIRRYFKIGNDSKIFLNGFLVLDKGFSGSRVEWKAGSTLNTITNLSGGLGTGINKNRFSVECRYYFGRKIVANQNDVYKWRSSYQKVSLIMGYRLFNGKRGTH
jgi:hypothetical protein